MLTRKFTFSLLYLLVLTLSLSLFSSNLHAQGMPLTKGVDFWTAFPYNTSGNNSMELKITANTNVSGNISSPQGYNQNFTAGPGNPYTVIIPSSYVIQSNQTVENKGIHITSSDSIRVYAGTIALGGGDGVSVLATPAMGTSYRIISYRNFNPTTILLVSPTNGNVVTVNPRFNTLSGNPANVPFTVTLNQGQTYMVRANGDLTGSLITSSAPIQAYGHSRCSQVPTGQIYCDCIWSMTLPTDQWGTEYVTGRLDGRNNRDVFRILAHQNGTQVNVNGGPVATLNAGQFYETTLSNGNWITANNPVGVVQYIVSKQYASNITGDPGMITLVPTSGYGESYRFSTALTSSIGTHYITVTAPTAFTSTVRYDGAAMAGWQTIAGSGYSYTSRSIPVGEHTLNAAAPIHAVVYGFGGVNSYGFPIAAHGTPPIVLPSDLIQLKGQLDPGTGALLSWQPSPDLQTNLFYLEKNTGKGWERIAEMPNHSGKDHSYTDREMQPNSSADYRVFSFDPDGNRQVSNTVNIFRPSLESGFTIGPNPFRDHLQVQIDRESEQAFTIRIMDARGKLLHALQSESSITSLDLSAYFQKREAGVYFIEVVADGQSFKQKVIKQ